MFQTNENYHKTKKVVDISRLYRGRGSFCMPFAFAYRKEQETHFVSCSFLKVVLIKKLNRYSFYRL